MRKILILALFAIRAFAACASGYISIVDPFTLPNGQSWTGSIVYTLAYNTTVAGATTVQAQQNLQVTNGINICLAPGLYTPVQFNQSGVRYVLTQSWGVPSTGGPYTIAQIQGTITLGGGAQGPAGPTGPAGATGPQGPTGATGPSGGLLQRTDVIMTEAQFIALGVTKAVLIPAQGAGTMIVPLYGILNQTGTPSYASSQNELNFNIGTVQLSQWTILGQEFDLTYIANNNFLSFAGAINGVSTLWINQPFTVQADSAITGAGGPVQFTIWWVLWSSMT